MLGSLELRIGRLDSSANTSLGYVAFTLRASHPTFPQEDASPILEPTAIHLVADR